MSAFSPPIYYFSGIGFDTNYFITASTTGLTQSQANALYLQKTTSDVDPYNVTFTSGIVTNSITNTAAASAVNLFSSTTGTLSIGSGSTMPLNLYGIINLPNFNTTNYYSYVAGGAQTIANITDTKILYPTVLSAATSGLTYAAGNFTNSSPNMLTVMGTYSVSITANVTGYRTIYVSVGGTRYGEVQIGTSQTVIYVGTSSFTIRLASSASFSVFAYQNSGSVLTALQATINPTCIDFVAF